MQRHVFFSETKSGYCCADCKKKIVIDDLSYNWSNHFQSHALLYISYFHICRSPLHAACFKGDAVITDLLLSAGARVNTKDSKW